MWYFARSCAVSSPTSGIASAWIAYGVRVYWLSVAGLVTAGLPIALAAGTTAFFYAGEAFAH